MKKGFDSGADGHVHVAHTSIQQNGDGKLVGL